MADALCDHCKKPIGYETHFYEVSPRKGDKAPLVLAHAACAEDDMDRLRQAGDQ